MNEKNNPSVTLSVYVGGSHNKPISTRIICRFGRKRKSTSVAECTAGANLRRRTISFEPFLIIGSFLSSSMKYILDKGQLVPLSNIFERGYNALNPAHGEQTPFLSGQRQRCGIDTKSKIKKLMYPYRGPGWGGPGSQKYLK